ncbi:MAG: GlsB/YeaQ/YmgE family stress response membrane protein [Thermomicrobiales bacterium]
MGLITWLIFGALAGWLASLIAKTNKEQGWALNIVLGIIGALVGGFLYRLITGDGFAAGFNIGSLIVAIVGALIVTFAFQAMTGRRI